MRKICHLWGKVHLKSPPKKCSFKTIPIIPPSCLWYQQLSKLSQYDTLSLICLILFPLSFWLFFWFPFDTFPDFLVILFPISPSPAPELASWVWLTAGEGVLCVWGCSAKEIHIFFECCGPFYFPLKFGCKTNYFASQVFAVCHFVSWDVSGWGLLCKRNTNPAFAGQLTKKFNFLIRENLTWTNDCPLVWENENI